MKKIAIILILCILLPAANIAAQEVSDTVKIEKTSLDRKKMKKLRKDAELIIEDTLTNEYLDTVNIRKNLELNDYTMIGFQYGAGLSQVMWNPSQKQDMLFMPVNVGFMYTRYGKMFGYMPYFGFQAEGQQYICSLHY